jgi:hypothetical protein
VTQAAFSHEHKFIFLTTKKTAGTSIELALTQLCGTDYIIAPHRDRRGKRISGRGLQNCWWGSPRRRWFKYSGVSLQINCLRLLS